MELYEIVSLSGYDVSELADIIRCARNVDKIGEKLIAYMSQWDYGDRGELISEEEAKVCSLSDWFENGNYLVVWSDKIDPWAVLYGIIK